MKKLLIILFCLLPIVGSCQSKGNYTKSSEEYKYTHKFKIDLYDQLVKELENVNTLQYKMILKLRKQNDELCKQVVRYERIYRGDSISIPIKPVTIKGYRGFGWQIDSIKGEYNEKPDFVKETPHGNFIIIDTTKVRTRQFYKATDGNMYQIPIK